MSTAVAEKTSEKFLYDQVSNHVLELVDSGVLKPGDKAPSLRKLSQQLRVSITTVSQGYALLAERGVLESRPQSGFYINTVVNQPDLPRKTSTCCRPRKVRFGELFEEVFNVANDPDVVPLGAALPAMELLPIKGLQRATSRVLSRHAESCMNYCFPPGHLRLREEIARRYVEIGLAVDPDDVIITTGATEALALSLQTVAQRGDIIAVESPMYFSVLRLIEKLGMLAVELDTDPETGLCLDALESALETMDIKAVVTVPNFSNPIGSLMPEDNKRRMVEILEAANVPLIEDDIYGELYFDDERPRMAKCYERKGGVLSCSSFSKTLAPGYRIGWIIADQQLHHRILEWKQASSSASPSLGQYAIAEYLASGEYERHVQRLRNAYRTQTEQMRFMLAQHFPAGTRISNPRGGFVLWVEMPRGNDCIDVFNQALERGISLLPGILFSATRRYKNFIRISCGQPWSESLERSVIELASLINPSP
jgi:DNA-binding transcriptional MocR family regulator